MVSDHYIDRWNQWDQQPSWPVYIPPQISTEEIAEFKRLLERAREYDKAHNEPNCQLDEKKTKLKALLGELTKELNLDELLG